MTSLAATTIVIGFLTAGTSVAETAPAEEAGLRHSRYQVIALLPSPAQRDLLRAVVDIEFSAEVETVGDAIRVILQGSGYRLTAAPCQNELFGLPLPAVHRKLGPLALEQVPPAGADQQDDCHCA